MRRGWWWLITYQIGTRLQDTRLGVLADMYDSHKWSEVNPRIGVPVIEYRNSLVPS